VGISIALAGLGALEGLAGGIEANQTRQKQKGIIGKAFTIAKQRQAISQTDQRQSTAEGAVARGLTSGGGVTTGGPASLTTPGVSGANTLGGQIGQDLGREQSLEVQDTNAQEQAALSGVNAQANAGEIGAAASGVGGALSGVAAGQEYNAWGGIHPVQPFGIGGGGGTPTPTTSSFNVFGDDGQ
jgi:hypothetical protein